MKFNVVSSFNILIIPVRFLGIPKTEAAIGCFVCSSFNKYEKFINKIKWYLNRSNPSCEDTFNSTILQTGVQGSNEIENRTFSNIYQFPCWAMRKRRVGLFPADHCLKINGYKCDLKNFIFTVS